MYKTKFYARTWVLWLGFFLSSLCMLYVCVLFFGFLGLLFYFNMDKADWASAAVVIMFNFFICFPFFISFTFRLVACQKPNFSICKEGVELRVIGKPIPSRFLLLGKFALFLLPFELWWQLLSSRMFQFQIIRLPWKDFDTITYDHGHLDITGLYVDENSSWTERNPFSFKANAFGVSTKTVEMSLRYYLDNTLDRESLPSWDTIDECF